MCKFMPNNKPKYLIQCAKCGTLLFKTEQGLMFNTKIKCPACGKFLQIPDDIVITKEEKVINRKNLTNNS